MKIGLQKQGCNDDDCDEAIDENHFLAFMDKGACSATIPNKQENRRIVLALFSKEVWMGFCKKKLESKTIGRGSVCAAHAGGEGGSWAPRAGGEIGWRRLVVDLGAGEWRV